MVLPFLQPHNSGAVLSVRAAPKASRSKIAGIIGDELKVALQAPPVDGAANQELICLLSKLFRVSKSSIELLSGETTRSKRVLICGKSIQEVEDALRAMLSL